MLILLMSFCRVKSLLFPRRIYHEITPIVKQIIPFLKVQRKVYWVRVETKIFSYGRVQDLFLKIMFLLLMTKL